MTPTDEGVTFEQAMEVHRLYRVDFLSPLQICKETGLIFPIVSRILAGRIFPGALRSWERKE